MFAPVLQALLNGLVSGTILAVPAIGFTAMFALLRYGNFAVGALATVGAYGGYVANVFWGWPALASLAAAFAVAGFAGLAMDRLALKPLKPSGALVVAIASLAAGLVLENIIRWFFANELRAFDLPILRDFRFGDLRMGPQQLQNFGLALAIMGAIWLFLSFTRLGRAMRAVADNPDLAMLKGIEPERVAIIATVVGSGLVGVGGMLLGLDTSIDPLTGNRVLLSVFAAAVLGGLGSAPGAVLGAVLIGVAEELTVLFAAPAYRSAIGFLVILIVLTIRPAGLFGERN
ncbi:MAG: branched-chain amino acid ABC transporter permease [Alphaproteobacteria bacterium]|nr:branched-chain amino acid ABC transporter permease [Alphaproteobacteria bacterium]